MRFIVGGPITYKLLSGNPERVPNVHLPDNRAATLLRPFHWVSDRLLAVFSTRPAFGHDSAYLRPSSTSKQAKLNVAHTNCEHTFVQKERSSCLADFASKFPHILSHSKRASLMPLSLTELLVSQQRRAWNTRKGCRSSCPDAVTATLACYLSCRLPPSRLPSTSYHETVGSNRRTSSHPIISFGSAMRLGRTGPVGVLTAASIRLSDP